jgi:hypothetical protein
LIFTTPEQSAKIDHYLLYTLKKIQETLEARGPKAKGLHAQGLGDIKTKTKIISTIATSEAGQAATEVFD